MKFNPAHWSIQQEIDKRVQLEDLKRWAAQVTPEFQAIPDEPLKIEPSLIIIKRFVMGLRP